MARPGPKPRHRRPIQLELIDASEAKGEPPRCWTVVDRMAAAGRREVTRLRNALIPLGWVLKENREGWWVAYSRSRHRTERNYTAAGLLHTIQAIEGGDATGQRELFTIQPLEANG